MKYFKILFSILIFFIGAQSMSFQFDQFENINSSSPQSKEAEENKSQDEVEDDLTASGGNEK